MRTKFTLFSLLRLSLLLVLHHCEPAMANTSLLQELDTGCIDWSAGTVRASGIGAPSTVGDGHATDSPSDIVAAARRMAQSNLLNTLGAIRIDAESRVADLVAQSAAFRDGLTSLVRNAAITRKEYLSDGTLKIELTMSLTGGFSQFVLPEEIRQVDSVTPVPDAEPSATASAAPKGSTDARPYTGLILDAGGIGVKPSLAPLVVDEAKEVVYGPAFVSREFAVSQGMSGFATSLAASRDDERVGSRPMVVKAIRTHSTGVTDLVISNADAARLRSSVMHLNFLKACRVSIVMNPATSP